MNGTEVTPAEIMSAIGFFILVSGVLWGIWWRIEGKVAEVRKESTERTSAATALATLAHDKLAEHKLHVAESYITKAGMREVKDEIMEAIHGVKGAVDHLGGRIDGIYQQNSTPRPIRKSGG